MKTNATKNNNQSPITNRMVEVGEKASIHSNADSLDMTIQSTSVSNQHSSSLNQEFPSEATNYVNTGNARRYVNSKSVKDEKGSKEAFQKEGSKGFHQNCKLANFNIRKTSK